MKQILTAFFALASFFIALISWHPASLAQDSSETAPAIVQTDFSELIETGSGRVVNIINPLTLELEDGRKIYLSGLDFPDLDYYDPGELAVTAQKIMTDMLKDQHVLIYQTKSSKYGRTNRMGEMIAHLMRKEGNLWVQGTLLSLGLARVRTTADTPEMAAQMYALESQARQEKLGLWNIIAFQVSSPDDAEKFIGTYHVIEGQILGASMKKNRLYLNFGKNWKNDFTVSISASDRRVFQSKGHNPQDWMGRKVRVRGWLGSYNGAYMEIDHPERFELLEDTIVDNNTEEPDASDEKEAKETSPTPQPDEKVDVPVLKGSGLPDAGVPASDHTTRFNQ